MRTKKKFLIKKEKKGRKILHVYKFMIHILSCAATFFYFFFLYNNNNNIFFPFSLPSLVHSLARWLLYSRPSVNERDTHIKICNNGKPRKGSRAAVLKAKTEWELTV